MDKSDIKERFEQVTGPGINSRNIVIIDKETGIEYLYHIEGATGGLTVLLDRDGKPKISQDFH